MQASRYDSYILCTSPRSGSTLLCRMLYATGIAGHPESWFHRPTVDQWRKKFGLPPDADLACIIAAGINAGRAGGNLFALRLQRHSFNFLQQQLTILHPDAQTDPSRFSASFGRIKYIYLTRPDKLAQAVSYVRATQSGLWHRNADGSEYERLAPERSPVYDHEAIAQSLVNLTAQDHAWQDWFARNQISPLALNYDDLSSDPSSVLALVLDALGLNARAAQTVDSPTARLADEINAEWIARFKASSL